MSFLGSRRNSRGLTLIELLVAMVVGLVVVLVAVAALTIARRGFSTVDAASQLRDNARFAADLVQRVGAQAGYRDVFVAAGAVSSDDTREPNVGGFDNALIDESAPLTTYEERDAAVPGYGSDVLALRYQAPQLYTGAADPTKAKVSDESMIDCSGNAIATVPNPNDTDAGEVTKAFENRIVSIFHVAINQGEPALMCTYSATGAAPWTTVPVIQGVENFQVLYGVDGVTPNTAPATTEAPDVPDAYLRADQMVVAGNAPATRANWRRVRSIRIGMVVRSAPGATQDSDSQTYFPFGDAKASANGNRGSAFANSNDPGTTFVPTPDGRLRQALSFTIHLRNDQSL